MCSWISPRGGRGPAAVPLGRPSDIGAVEGRLALKAQTLVLAADAITTRVMQVTLEDGVALETPPRPHDDRACTKALAGPRRGQEKEA